MPFPAPMKEGWWAKTSGAVQIFDSVCWQVHIDLGLVAIAEAAFVGIRAICVAGGDHSSRARQLSNSVKVPR